MSKKYYEDDNIEESEYPEEDAEYEDGEYDEYDEYDDYDEYDEDDEYDEYEPDDEDEEEYEAPKKSVKKKKPLTAGQWALAAVVIVLCTALLLGIGWVVLYKPAQSDDVPFNTDPVDTADPSDSGTDDTGSTPSGTKDTASTTDPVDDVFRVENTDSYNILVVGHDKLAGLADVTMIVNIDAKNHAITIMQIPRDTYVDVSAEDEEVYLYTNKVNEIFSRYFELGWAYGDETEQHMYALQHLASFLERTLCINIHHSIVVDLEGFKVIVDSIGGVELYVPSRMYYEDPYQGLVIDLYEGYQNLNGAQAEQFVRFRSGWIQADLGRVNAQKIFMTAFFNKMKYIVKTVDLNKLTSVAEVALEYSYSDLTTSDVIYYAKQLLNINKSSVKMMTIPGNMDSTGAFYVINKEAVLQAINKYYNIYNKDITPSIFDRNKAFCDEYDYGISSVYDADPSYVFDGEYSADEIDENSIYIPSF